MTKESLDKKYMRMALRLATKAQGRTSPNPLVGAIVVKDGKVLSRGYHPKAGDSHAEVLALKKAGEAAEGATLYVTLEPCTHTDKRTPPCCPLVIQSGVKRVVVAMIDPNPRVSGKGILALRKAGIEVETKVLEAEAKKMNEAFIKHITTGMPFVTLKIAQTLDGKIATAAGESKWITGEEAREAGRRLRGCNDAILVGINTILKDDPALTTRVTGARDPIRVIVDTHARIPLHARVLTHMSAARTIVAVGKGASQQKIKKLQALGAEVIFVKLAQGRIQLRELMRELGKRDILSVLIEGGAEVNASALASGLVDKAVVFIAPLLMTGKDSLCSIGGVSPRKLRQTLRLTQVTSEFVGQDLMITGYL
jgi:diaminohydroxyphosphoribosylaminopyrimidine deaminase/5-amino-6-(5-phosphoribosylamino)uracil reductase